MNITVILMIVVVFSIIGLISFFIFSLTPKVVLVNFQKPIMDCNRGIVKLFIEYAGSKNLTKNEIKMFLNGKQVRENLYDFA
ncbi:MAG: hypothetical protein QXS69_03695, partial [Candidatus Aenigmatarchaeota archaeon]